jgi:hypothetical protein
MKLTSPLEKHVQFWLSEVEDAFTAMKDDKEDTFCFIDLQLPVTILLQMAILFIVGRAHQDLL